jgi:hypothetical protein
MESLLSGIRFSRKYKKGSKATRQQGIREN